MARRGATEPTQCYEPGCPNPPGGYRSPYWCEQHDRERIARITAQLEAIVQDMESRLAPASGEEER